MKTYLAYFFDMDGTLVNSEGFKGMALSETCKLFGGQAASENYRAVMGENWSIVMNHFFKLHKFIQIELNSILNMIKFTKNR